MRHHLHEALPGVHPAVALGPDFFFGLSLTLLTMVLKRIEVSIAYAIWSGVGTAIITTVGILYFKEALTLLKLISLALVIIGVIGLNLSEGMH
jgi:small multidrug resistance pump